MKTFAGRDQDWQDIRGVILRSAERLDWDLIFNELSVLLELKEEPEALERLPKMKADLRP